MNLEWNRPNLAIVIDFAQGPVLRDELWRVDELEFLDLFLGDRQVHPQAVGMAVTENIAGGCERDRSAPAGNDFAAERSQGLQGAREGMRIVSPR